MSKSRHSIAHVPLEDLSHGQITLRRGFHERIMEVELMVIVISLLTTFSMIPLAQHLGWGYIPLIITGIIALTAIALYRVSSVKTSKLDNVDGIQAHGFFETIRVDNSPAAQRSVDDLRDGVNKSIEDAPVSPGLLVTRKQALEMAEALRDRHFNGEGCGTHGSNGCSNCFGPSPMTAEEIVSTVLRALGATITIDLLPSLKEGDSYRVRS